jgi:hypothetical protein
MQNLDMVNERSTELLGGAGVVRADVVENDC